MSRKASSAPEWKFSQVLGEGNPAEEVLDVDIISAIEFDKSGKYLATGDNGGRIVLFEQTNEKDDLPRKVLEHSDCCSSTTHPQYGYKTEFQSHEPEFDYLRSLEIGEKINKVRWCVTPNDSLFILSANDRTIKLWKISKILEACSARCRRVYAHAHDYNINSISNNSDGETYLSADDLRINLWNLEIGDQCFNIIDMVPSDMENLTG